MTKEYKTLRIPKEIHAELEEEKREGETWHGLMRRLLDGNQSPFSQEMRDELDRMNDVLKDGLLSEEAKQSLREMSEKMERMPERTADELEGRMR